MFSVQIIIICVMAVEYAFISTGNCLLLKDIPNKAVTTTGAPGNSGNSLLFFIQEVSELKAQLKQTNDRLTSLEQREAKLLQREIQLMQKLEQLNRTVLECHNSASTNKRTTANQKPLVLTTAYQKPLHTELTTKSHLSSTFTKGNPTLTNSLQQLSALRLDNVTHTGDGRLEVYNGGHWTPVCDDSFTDNDAKVACRMMNLPWTGAIRIQGGKFIQGSGNVFLHDVKCDGTEQSFAKCRHDLNGKENCGGYSHYVGIILLPAKFQSHSLVPGSGGVWLSGLGCSGGETSIAHCPHPPYGSSSCSHFSDVSVKCQHEAISVRLVGGNSSSEGRVEVNHNGIWGTVCDDNWDQKDAQVVCRMLGISGTAVPIENFGGGSGPILMDEVDCLGDETTLSQCSMNGEQFGVQNCQHSEDAGVICDAH